MSKRSLLLVNRHARRGKDTLSDALNQLKSLGFELFEESTEKPQQISDIIRRYRDRVDMVIVGGGDGTLNAATAGLVETQLPLGILPLGTANDLARTLGIPNSLTEACNIIANGEVKRIDIGGVNDKYFFNVASMGLTVQITRNLSKEAKRRWGVLAYAATAMQVISRSRPFNAQITINGASVVVKTAQIAVGNGRFYGGGMVVAEDATINDARLDLYSLEYKHWWQVVGLLPGMWQGTQGKSSAVRALQGQEIEVNTKTPRPISADGEIITYTPAKFRVIPQSLSVIVSKSPEIPGLQEEGVEEGEGSDTALKN